MGTPEFSIPTLSKILEKGHEVVAVYSQPPRKAGRGGKVRKTPVHTFAEKQGIPVFTPQSLKKEGPQEEFKNAQSRCCCCDCLWLTVAETHPRGLPSWVFKCSRVFVAKMARGSPHSKGDYGW